MIDKEQIRDLIRVTLTQHGLYSGSALDLVYGTIGHESLMGTYIKQKPKGKFDYSVHGLGIAQMEHKTFCWLCDKYGEQYNFTKKEFLRLEYDLKFSILLCRLRYLAVPEPLPTTLSGLAHYYKKYYNTKYGSATEKDFIDIFNT